jgi:two-component system sensor histidine kinase KdpD
MDTTPEPKQSPIERIKEALGPLDFGARGKYAYWLTAGAIAAVTLPMLAFRDSLGILNVALVYLLLVFVVALFAGPGPASAAAVISFAVYDFAFIPPFHTFTIARSDHVLALFVYLGVAVVTGQLVSRVRSRTEIAEREQRRTTLLYELNAALIGDVTLDQILDRIVERVVTVYRASGSQLLLPDRDGQLEVRAAYPKGRMGAPNRQQLVVADWVMEHRAPAGQSSAGRRIRPPHGVGDAATEVVRRDNDVLFLPVATADRVVGVLGVSGKPGGGRFDAEDEQLLISFANQAALALERARLSAEAIRADALAQSDELKSALLAAVSHDLRTPLSAIKASATSLLDSSVDWDETARREFLEAIDEETDRLTMMVGNLLDLSRIEGGALRPDREWYDVAELIGDVARRLRARSAGHPMSSEAPSDLPLLWFDYVEVAQVLMNLGENAIKYTPAGTPIHLSARRAGNAIEFSVSDRGPGIPKAQVSRLFEKFYRGETNGRAPGTGIGLTISKGLVEAHGGRIWVESTAGEGTTFRFTIPLTEGTPNGG